MIDESVALPRGAGQARDLRRRALLRRLAPTTPTTPCRLLRAAAEAGADARLPVRHQRRRAAAGDRSDVVARGRRRALAGRVGRHARAQRRRLRRGQLARGRGRRRRARCRAPSTATASAAATPTSPRIIPGAEAQDGPAGGQRRAARAPDRDGPLRGRRRQRHAVVAPALRGPQRLRPQGRPARRRDRGRAPQTFEHVDSGSASATSSAC